MNKIRGAAFLFLLAPLAFTQEISESSPNRGRGESLLASIDAVFSGSYPLARYADFSVGALGLGLAADLRVPDQNPGTFWTPLRLHLNAEGLFHLPNPTSSVTSLYELSGGLGLGWRFQPMRGFLLIPVIGYGGTSHFLSATREGIGVADGQFFYNQTASFESEFEIVSGGWGLLLSLGYRVFFDDLYLGHSLTCRTGVRFEFR